MYRPNSIQSRLVIKEEEPGALLQEVNETIEDLRKWKEDQKRLDEELEKSLLDQKLRKKVEIDEETSTNPEMVELDIKDIKCEQRKLIQISNKNLPMPVNLPEIQAINSFELFKAGSELHDILNDWNSSLDFLMTAPGTNEKKKTEEWDQVEEIEKELEELEELMGSVPNLED
jgi:hypothetical protein